MGFFSEVIGSFIWEVAIKDNPKAKKVVNDVLKYSNDQGRKAVNVAQKKLDGYSSRYDEMSNEGKAKYDSMQSQILKAEKKCDANEKAYNKFQGK